MLDQTTMETSYHAIQVIIGRLQVNQPKHHAPTHQDTSYP